MNNQLMRNKYVTINRMQCFIFAHCTNNIFKKRFLNGIISFDFVCKTN